MFFVINTLNHNLYSLKVSKIAMHKERISLHLAVKHCGLTFSAPLCMRKGLGSNPSAARTCYGFFSGFYHSITSRRMQNAYITDRWTCRVRFLQPSVPAPSLRTHRYRILHSTTFWLKRRGTFQQRTLHREGMSKRSCIILSSLIRIFEIF